MEPGAGGKPTAHFLMFMRTIVIDNKMDVEFIRDVLINMPEKRKKLLVPVTLPALGHDTA